MAVQKTKKEPTLNAVLRRCGYKTWPYKHRHIGMKHIVNQNGEIVFTGGATEVWRWLRDTGQCK